MMIQWLDDAVNDLQSLQHYISQDNKMAARKVVKTVLHAIDALSEHPAIGRPGRVPNTRELIVSGMPYIIPYRVKHNVIQILRVFHCAMRWPEDF